MYQKAISADPEILIRNFLQEREITGWKNGRVSTCIAWITDTFTIARAAFTRAKSAKSKINPDALGDNRRDLRGKLRKGGKQTDITTGRSNYCVYTGGARLLADNFHLCQVSARATFSRCSTPTIHIELTAILAKLLHQRSRARSRKIIS